MGESKFEILQNLLESKDLDAEETELKIALETLKNLFESKELTPIEDYDTISMIISIEKIYQVEVIHNRRFDLPTNIHFYPIHTKQIDLGLHHMYLMKKERNARHFRYNPNGKNEDHMDGYELLDILFGNQIFSYTYKSLTGKGEFIYKGIFNIILTTDKWKSMVKNAVSKLVLLSMD